MLWGLIAFFFGSSAYLAWRCWVLIRQRDLLARAFARSMLEVVKYHTAFGDPPEPEEPISTTTSEALH